MARTLQPILAEPRRQTLDAAERVYLRCYLWLRLLIGLLGILLPTVLLLGDWGLLAGPFAARGSLSAYYHSGMRDIFVGFLFVIGVFLMTYKAFEIDWENLLSVVAGVAALVVAVFPTDRPAEVKASSPKTPLQEALGEGLVAHVHYSAAAILIVFLGVISVFFGIREGKRPRRSGNRSPMFWRWFHWACAILIVGACVYILLANQAHAFNDTYSLLIGESIAVVSFGVSWLLKGAELDMLGAKGR